MPLDPVLRREIERCFRRWELELLERLEASASRTDSFGKTLTTAEAAKVCGVTSEAIRLRCEQSHEQGEPIAQKVGPMWIIPADKLLADLERRKGTHARLQAETELRNLPKTWADTEDAPEIGP